MTGNRMLRVLPGKRLISNVRIVSPSTAAASCRGRKRGFGGQRASVPVLAPHLANAVSSLTEVFQRS